MINVMQDFEDSQSGWNRDKELKLEQEINSDGQGTLEKTYT